MKSEKPSAGRTARRAFDAVLALGSNIGDKRANIARALELLSEKGDINIVKRSRDYRSAPWGIADQDWFGAHRVLVLSASSKTAIGFARCADQRPGLEVIGVTSARNHAFTHALGCYDEVLTYDDVAAIPPHEPIVSIDMAGSGPVLAAVKAEVVTVVGGETVSEGAWAEGDPFREKHPGTWFSVN